MIIMLKLYVLCFVINTVFGTDYSTCGMESEHTVGTRYDSPDKEMDTYTQIGEENEIARIIFPRGMRHLKSEEAQDRRRRVVNGEKAESLKTFPWIADLSIIVKLEKEEEHDHHPFNAHQCGAAIISEYFLLTAAHCILQAQRLAGRTNLTEYLRVSVGEFDQSKPDSLEEDFHVEAAIIHENYDLTDFLSEDIALIKIKAKDGHGITFNKHVQPICLPSSTTPHTEGNLVLAAGWGLTLTDHDIMSNYSRFVHLGEVPIMPLSRCDIYCDIMEKIVEEGEVCLAPGQLCAGHTEFGANACQGDSGGPLVQNINGRFTLMGLTSFGSSICGTVELPVVYTKVQHFLSWILTTMENLASSSARLETARVAGAYGGAAGAGGIPEPKKKDAPRTDEIISGARTFGMFHGLDAMQKLKKQQKAISSSETARGPGAYGGGGGAGGYEGAARAGGIPELKKKDGPRTDEIISGARTFGMFHGLDAMQKLKKQQKAISSSETARAPGAYGGGGGDGGYEDAARAGGIPELKKKDGPRTDEIISGARTFGMFHGLDAMQKLKKQQKAISSSETARGPGAYGGGGGAGGYEGAARAGGIPELKKKDGPRTDEIISGARTFGMFHGLDAMQKLKKQQKAISSSETARGPGAYGGGGGDGGYEDAARAGGIPELKKKDGPRTDEIISGARTFGMFHGLDAMQKLKKQQKAISSSETARAPGAYGGGGGDGGYEDAARAGGIPELKKKDGPRTDEIISGARTFGMFHGLDAMQKLKKQQKAISSSETARAPGAYGGGGGAGGYEGAARAGGIPELKKKDGPRTNEIISGARTFGMFHGLDAMQKLKKQQKAISSSETARAPGAYGGGGGAGGYEDAARAGGIPELKKKDGPRTDEIISGARSFGMFHGLDAMQKLKKQQKAISPSETARAPGAYGGGGGAGGYEDAARAGGIPELKKKDGPRTDEIISGARTFGMFHGLDAMQKLKKQQKAISSSETARAPGAYGGRGGAGGYEGAARAGGIPELKKKDGPRTDEIISGARTCGMFHGLDAMQKLKRQQKAISSSETARAPGAYGGAAGAGGIPAPKKKYGPRTDEIISGARSFGMFDRLATMQKLKKQQKAISSSKTERTFRKFRGLATMLKAKKQQKATSSSRMARSLGMLNGFDRIQKAKKQQKATSSRMAVQQ